MLRLQIPTPAAWVDAVRSDLDAFLIDHAACERKASATGMAFVVRYPDRTELLAPMIQFAREELAHFQQVVALLTERGLQMGPDEKDPYVGSLLAEVRAGRDERLLDRLLVSGIVEARGCERFGILAQRLEPPLADFYRTLSVAEAKHHMLFYRLARLYFDEQAVAHRLTELLDRETELVQSLPLRPAVH